MGELCKQKRIEIIEAETSVSGRIKPALFGS
jgi:hypothetical protein